MRRDPRGSVIVELTIEERLQNPRHLTARGLLRSSDESTEDLHDHVLSSAEQRAPPRSVIDTGTPRTARQIPSGFRRPVLQGICDPDGMIVGANRVPEL